VGGKTKKLFTRKGKGKKGSNKGEVRFTVKTGPGRKECARLGPNKRMSPKKGNLGGVNPKSVPQAMQRGKLKKRDMRHTKTTNIVTGCFVGGTQSHTSPEHMPEDRIFFKGRSGKSK